jgi:eukaryotic-like serine/threonine-protein kinase
MEPDRWEQIERLYHAALERDPDARDEFLDEACAGDENLRREIAGLLACDASSDSFIQSPAIEIAARAMAAEPLIEASNKPMGNLIAGSQIGAYQLLSPLGRGGMGEVHLALDTRLKRKVAIKLLPVEFTAEAGPVTSPNGASMRNPMASSPTAGPGRTRPICLATTALFQAFSAQIN